MELAKFRVRHDDVYVCLTMSADELKFLLHTFDSIEAPELSTEQYDILIKLRDCLGDVKAD